MFLRQLQKQGEPSAVLVASSRRLRYSAVVGILAALAMLVSAVLPSTAAPIFSEDFQGIAVGALTPSTAGSPFDTIVGGTNHFANVEADAAVPPYVFGPAAGNQYLRFVDGGSGTPYISTPVSIVDSIFMLTFDFYEPTDSLASSTRLALSDISNSSSGGGRILDIGFNNGALQNSSSTVATYVQGQKHSVTIVGNYTDATYDYILGGAQSVAAGTFDLFLNGSIIPATNDLAFRKAPVALVGSTHFGISGASSNGTSAAYFDNISISIVPEPSAFILASVSMFGMVVFRRQQIRS